jgi:hypothetical protein
VFLFCTGIPISHQHLIWQSVELEDEYCLHDYQIHSGATLKLVLAMRGGPINTRRSEWPPVAQLFQTGTLCWECILHVFVDISVLQTSWFVEKVSKKKNSKNHHTTVTYLVVFLDGVGVVESVTCQIPV